MRTWGRKARADGSLEWVAVESDPDGDFTYGWITTLIQTLKLSPGESPFYAQYGIPAQQSILTQVYPDYYVAQVQQQFASCFANLTIYRDTTKPEPTYIIDIVTLKGVTYREVIAV